MRQPAQFEYRDEFADFLPENGVPNSGQNYLTWMNRAAKLLRRRIGPSELSCEADVQRLLSALKISKVEKGSWATKEYAYEKNLQSTFRKYVQMVQGNYRGLFANIPAAPAPVANDVPDGLPDKIKQTVLRFVRDTKTAREIKRLYEFRCQVCGVPAPEIGCVCLAGANDDYLGPNRVHLFHNCPVLLTLRSVCVSVWNVTPYQVLRLLNQFRLRRAVVPEFVPFFVEGVFPD